jgi:peptide/nickel transport system permease protein
MRRYFLIRCIYLFITIILILSFNFFLFKVMPGDPVRLMFPKGAPPDVIEFWRHILGLDKPLWEQYLAAIIGPFTGDFGVSIRFAPRTPIGSILVPYIEKTVFLCGVGTVIAIYFGIIIGRKSAWKKGKPYDRWVTSISVVIYSIPTFLYALFFIVIFSLIMPGWPFQGATSPIIEFNSLDLIGQITDIAQHALLPILSLVIESLAGFSLIMRSSLIDVLTDDYILTAEAKGLDEEGILKKHAMPNAYLPILAEIAMNVGWILGGTIMIEYIFTYKGLGYLSWEAVLSYDFPLLQATFILEVVAVLVANFIADILNFYLDPRVKI